MKKFVFVLSDFCYISSAMDYCDHNTFDSDNTNYSSIKKTYLFSLLLLLFSPSFEAFNTKEARNRCKGIVLHFMVNVIFNISLIDSQKTYSIIIMRCYVRKCWRMYFCYIVTTENGFRSFHFDCKMSNNLNKKREIIANIILNSWLFMPRNFCSSEIQLSIPFIRIARSMIQKVAFLKRAHLSRPPFSSSVHSINPIIISTTDWQIQTNGTKGI